MDLIPSPLERLLNLERELEQLRASLVPESIRSQGQQSLPPRHIWPVDELLLTRILRRSPEAILAYQGHAELRISKQHGVRLTPVDAPSAIQFCEIMGGDAVAWMDAKLIKRLWSGDVFRSIFDVPSGVESPDQLVLQALPLFKAIARGQSWTLHRKGEMVVQARPFPEQTDQARVLRRLEALERRVSQHTVQLEAELKGLRIQLRVQQEEIERLLRLTALDPSRQH